jgi:rhodanese-related sulfurtransferase
LSILEQKGYKNIYALEAGFQSWLEAGYEISLNGDHA